MVPIFGFLRLHLQLDLLLKSSNDKRKISEKLRFLKRKLFVLVMKNIMLHLYQNALLISD